MNQSQAGPTGPLGGVGRGGGTPLPSLDPGAFAGKHPETIKQIEPPAESSQNGLSSRRLTHRV